MGVTEVSVLNITDLNVSAGQHPIVRKLDLSIQEGEWLTITGESGSGKSVTASVIGGLLPEALTVESGEILFCGSSLLTLSEKQMSAIRGKEIAYVFQDYTSMFAPFIPIGKQMDETARIHLSLTRKERKDQILHILRDVNLPAERVYESYPFQLSGGQLQRVSIAIAMMLQPKLLIADEPTTSLDSVTGEVVLRLLSKLKERTRCAILCITHDLRNVRRYADKIAIMHSGRIIEAGDKTAVLYQPRHTYTGQLLAAIPTLEQPPARLLTNSSGAYHSQLPRESRREKEIKPNLGDDLLTVKRMAKTYRKGCRALHDISFTVKPGECLGLVGESGSGKSTLARCLLLMEQADEGELWFQNVPLHERNAKAYRALRGHIQAVFQNPSASLNPKLRVIDSLMEPLDQWIDRSPSFLGGRIEARSKKAERLLDMVGLSAGVLHQYPHELSGGQKQRVSIARSISIGPAMIIMDEPTASLDVLIQAEILNLLKDLQEELGFSYLFISHDLAAVQFMCSRVLVMNDGQLVDECGQEDMFSSESANG